MSGAYQVHHVHHVPEVPEAVCLADDQSDLVVGRLETRVARAQANRARDVPLVAFDLGVQFPGRRGILLWFDHHSQCFRSVSAWSASVVPGRSRRDSFNRYGRYSFGSPHRIMSSRVRWPSVRFSGALPSAKAEPLMPAATFLASRLPHRNGLAVAGPGPAAVQPHTFGDPPGLFARDTPTFTAHLVERVHRPFDDIERVDATLAPRRELVGAVRDPAGPVPGHRPDARELFGRQAPVEPFEHQLAVPVADPDDRVRVMVHDHGHELVAFAVTGLVDPDVHSPSGRRPRSGSRSRNARDAHPPAVCQSISMYRDNRAARQVFRQPGDGYVELPGETAARVRPRDGRGDDTVLRVGDAMRRALDLDDDPRKIQATPHLVARRLSVIPGQAPPAAPRAVVPVPYVRTGPDPQTRDAVRAGVQDMRLHDRVLDIKVSEQAIPVFPPGEC